MVKKDRKTRPKDEDGSSGGDVRVFNLRNVPKRLFFRMKMAAAAEEKTPGEWIMGLAESRIRELEDLGRLVKEK